MATILQITLQAHMDTTLQLIYTVAKGGLAYAFDILMASQKPTMESRM
jgi:hypothetical protein